VVDEDTFKGIYAQFFPQGSKSGCRSGYKRQYKRQLQTVSKQERFVISEV